MEKLNLGRLIQLDLREYWEREDTHFTPWLAEEENISLLSDAIEIELEVQDQEARVGPFRADILCRNTSDDTLVLIENQLEKTDHSHLGQLLTYASGLDAVTLVWVVQTFTEEHRAALDWLNRITDEKFHFFGLEIELWSIGGSDAAPKFNVVAKPNDWSKTVKEAADTVRSKLTPWKQTQLEIWRAFGSYLEKHKIDFKPPKPSASLWMGYGVGKSGAALVVSFTKTEAFVHIQLNNTFHPEWFAALQNNRSEIEASLGFSLDWQERAAMKHAYIVTKRNADMVDQDKLKALKNTGPSDVRILSNARCLSEGVDVPSLDGVAFIDPKNSQVDIIQAVGRAIRLSKNKSVGTIVLPVFIRVGEDAEEMIEASSFQSVWWVLNALKAHDKALVDQLDAIRTEMGRKGASKVRKNTVQKIIVDLPATVGKPFSETLHTYLVEQTTASWSFRYGELLAFYERFSHCRVPSSWFENKQLAKWVSVWSSALGTLGHVCSFMASASAIVSPVSLNAAPNYHRRNRGSLWITQVGR